MCTLCNSIVKEDELMFDESNYAKCPLCLEEWLVADAAISEYVHTDCIKGGDRLNNKEFRNVIERCANCEYVCWSPHSAALAVVLTCCATKEHKACHMIRNCVLDNPQAVPVSEIYIEFDKHPDEENCSLVLGGSHFTPIKVARSLQLFAEFLNTLPADTSYACFDEGKMFAG